MRGKKKGGSHSQNSLVLKGRSQLSKKSSHSLTVTVETARERNQEPQEILSDTGSIFTNNVQSWSEWTEASIYEGEGERGKTMQTGQ